MRRLSTLGIGLMVAGATVMTIGGNASATTAPISNADFESCDLSGWNSGSQTGSLTGGTISGGGTGVTVITGAVSFSAPPGWEVGTPGTPYYQPATGASTWTFDPYGTCGVALQPKGEQYFDSAITALGLSSADNSALRSVMSSQANASGWGSGQPTDAAWITKAVTLTAGTTYTLSWNYIGTDYVPYNDGSITSLVFTGSGSTPTVTVNNQVQSYALLGFTNPGTGDYSTGTYGSTGWQVSTYQVSVTGDYLLGFAVFNLDDTALSPVLLVDSQPGSTTKNGEAFDAVPPNNSDAPTVPPATEPPATEPPATDPPATEPPATEPPATEPLVTEPPATEPPATDPPATEPPVTDPPATEPPATDPPATDEVPATDPPATEPEATDAPTTSHPRRTTTTTEPELIGETTTTPADSVAPESTPSETLPKTGSGSTPIAGLGLLMILGGFLTLMASHSRKRRI